MGVGSQRRYRREAGTGEVQSGGEPGASDKAGIAVKARSGGSATRQVPAVQPVGCAHPEGRHRQPLHGRVQLPAGLQRRIPLRQDLETALEEPHVPVPQEIQPFSFSAPRQSVVLRGRHAAPEATPTAIRKQLARGEKSTLASHGRQVGVSSRPETQTTAGASSC